MSAASIAAEVEGVGQPVSAQTIHCIKLVYMAVSQESLLTVCCRQMVSSVCGDNQVRSTKTSVSCLQSSMVVGVSYSGAA
ncbi:unnamed protein product [Staurois parvus]|uniref:Uncharacterized protein n=1 Tax=Staurois parvus TaxID=386267 RepID=A0ABN9EHR2_9NEOB|nr:unnamed protein product [Staurois parvus]